MTIKKPCWSWKYRIAARDLAAMPNRIYQEELNKLNRELWDQFGGCGDRWDLTYVRRRYNRNRHWTVYPIYYYDRIKIHFKLKEDYVIYKLSNERV